MGDAAGPRFGPISPISRQGTKMSCKNDVDDDNAGAAETADVTIAVNNDAATAVIKNQKQ